MAARAAIHRTERNPMDWALDLLSLTRKEFGELTSLSKPYLLRVSQGRQSQMGDRVQAGLYRIANERGVDLDGEILGRYGSATNLDEAWDLWIIRHRNAQTLPEPVKDRSINPFRRIVVAAGGVARMSALLAVHDHLVERYANGKTYAMPMPVMMALTDIGYEHINELDRAMRKWGEEHA